MTSGRGTVGAASVAMSPSRVWTVTRGRAAAAAAAIGVELEVGTDTEARVLAVAREEFRAGMVDIYGAFFVGLFLNLVLFGPPML